MSMYRMYAAEQNWITQYLMDRETVASGNLQAKLEYDPAKNKVNDRSILRYDKEKSEAHVEIVGPITPRGPDWIDAILGYDGTSTTEVVEAISEAAASDMRRIVLDMDTPGGQINGVDEIYDAIIAARNAGKECIAANHGMIASAGYWIAAACDEIYSAADTNETGSIGVVIVATDVSGALESMGIKRVFVVSENAEDKVPDIKNDSGLKILKDRVDAVERVFFDRIASGRGVTVKEIKEKYGRGRVYIARDPGGDDAYSRGMIDGMVSDMPAVQDETVDNGDNIAAENRRGVEQLAAREAHVLQVAGSSPAPAKTAGVSGEKSPAQGGKNRETSMTLEQIMSENPAIAAQVEKLQRENYERGRAEANAEHTKRVEAARPILSSADYGDDVKAVAVDVLTGEADGSLLRYAVQQADKANAEAKAKAATGETGETGDVPVEDVPQLSDDGVIRSEADYQAQLAAHRAAKGGE